MEIAKGAEAVLIRRGSVLIKKRIKKSYRLKELDIFLRKQRTKREIKLLSEARRIGLSVPKILNSTTYKIEMEFINGKTLKDVLNKKNYKQYAKLIAEIVSKLHSADIIHNDLTTSNMIVKNNKLYLIDFGLGFFSARVEDKATDLYLLKQVLKSTHPEIFTSMWNEISKHYKFRNVLEHICKIEKRGRYKKR